MEKGKLVLPDFLLRLLLLSLSLLVFLFSLEAGRLFLHQVLPAL